MNPGPGIYMCSAGGAMGWTPAEAPIREAVFRSANAFCDRTHKVMVPVLLETSPGRVGAHMASAILTFKAMAAGDPEIARTKMEVRNL